MPISQMSNSSPESGAEPIPMAKIAYFRQRLKNRIHQLVLREFRRFERQGLSRSELARRIHRRPEQITRWLGNPSNWTLDTLSDLMIGMGGEPDLYFVAPGERLVPERASAAQQPLPPAASEAPIPPVEGQRRSRTGDVVNMTDWLPRQSNTGDQVGPRRRGPIATPPDQELRAAHQ